jgi:chromosome segregation ATPase
MISLGLSVLGPRRMSRCQQVHERWHQFFYTSLLQLDENFFTFRARHTHTQARNADLARQLSALQSSANTTSPADQTHLRSLTDRAAQAEKRSNHLAAQLAQLEAKLAEMQSRSGQAEDKWEARVREYENRLRIAGEKIKSEKQGGKERAMQLEAQVR